MKQNQTSYSKDSCNTECKTYFYMGSRYFAEGNRDKARMYFQKSIDTREFLDLLPAITYRRLHQLQPN